MSLLLINNKPMYFGSTKSITRTVKRLKITNYKIEPLK